MIECESINELFAARIYDFDSDVVSFHEQALRIHYLEHGEERTHVPDFVVRRLARTDIDEIKDKLDEASEVDAVRSALLTPLLAQLGIRYRLRIVDKSRFRNRISFYRLILRLGRVEPTQLEREGARQLLKARSCLYWADVERGALGARSCSVAARLILEGAVFVVNVDEPSHDEIQLLPQSRGMQPPDPWGM
ncbi:MAG: hypothetical protein AAGA68_25840 [Pseudomonadota bacterium]